MRSRSFISLFVLLAAAAFRRAGVSSVAPGLSFRISSSTRISLGDGSAAGQEDEIMRGRGVAVGKHARIELLAFSPLPDNTTLEDFILALDSGRVVIIRPRNQTFTEASDQFGGPGIVALNRSGGGGRGFGGGPGGGDGAGGGGGRGAGRAGRGGGGPPPGGFGGGGRGGARGRGRGGPSGFLAETQIRDVLFAIEKLGAGEAVEGRPTQRYRITADYRVVWGGQSVDAHAVTEYVTAQLPVAIPNPFEPLPYIENVTDGPMLEYILKLIRIRNQVEGVPIKVTTTTTFKGVDQVTGFPLGGGRGRGGGGGGDAVMPSTLTVVQTTSITSIKEADVDAATLEIPAGFKAP